jgi:hypothetical protein
LVHGCSGFALLERQDKVMKKLLAVLVLAGFAAAGCDNANTSTVSKPQAAKDAEKKALEESQKARDAAAEHGKKVGEAKEGKK